MTSSANSVSDAFARSIGIPRQSGRKIAIPCTAFEWESPVVTGDTIVTEARIGDVTRKDRLTFHEVLTVSRNQRGEHVSTGTWTNIERGR